MDRQLKLRPQTPNGFFANGRSSQLPVPGTIARSTPVQTAAGLVYPLRRRPGQHGPDHRHDEFCRAESACRWTCSFCNGAASDSPSTARPCHGTLGDGNGITKKYGMAVIGNLHDKRIVQMPDGEIFNTLIVWRKA